MAYQINPFTGKLDITPFSLDGAGKIPSDYLPSYVDDVVEYDDLASFPSTGETGKIYVAKDTGYTYRWTGSVYVRIGSGGEVELNLGSDSSPSLYFTGDTNTGIYSPGADQLALSTNGTGRLFVDASGNVGIGTATSPDGTLHVNTASAGTVTPWANADDLTVENNGPTGISILAPDDQQAQIIFGNPSDNIGSIIRWKQDEDELQVGTYKTNGFLTLRTAVGSEAARIDSSGRLLVGTSSARAGSNFKDGGYTVLTQAEGGADNQSYGGSFVANSGTTNSTGRGCILTLGRTRGTSVNSNTSVANNDLIGRIKFSGADGTNLVPAAWIQSFVDGTPGTDDMPGRLVFSTTADGSASPSEAMRINNAGELLVGFTSDNGAYKLQVNSQIFATSATIATSDGRYKENVAALDGCVDLVKALRPVSFDWKAQEPVTRVDEDGETVVVREAHNFPDGKQVGFIAQEVEEVLADKPWLGSVIKQNVRPAVTDTDGNELAPEEEFLGIAEGNLVAVLTSALKDAIGRIESLEAEVAALKA